MDDREVGHHWEANAAEWVAAVRAGYDVCRTYINNPAFFAMLGDVTGLRIIDVGCGEGLNTRLVAQRGAAVVGVDISPTMIAAARQAEADRPLGIEYRVASGNDLSAFADASFDAAVSTMAMMDMADYPGALREVARVVKPGGFFQFSILHPCNFTARRRWIRNERGEREGILLGDYFGLTGQPRERIDQWYFGHAPPEVKEAARPFRVPVFFRTLSEYFNAIIEAGLVVERIDEPYASEAAARECPYVANSRLVPDYLILRCRNV